MAEGELIALKKKRSALKAQLTRFGNFVNSDTPNLSELSIRLQRIDHLLSDFEQVQYDLDLIADDESSATEIEQFENSYFKFISQAQHLLGFNQNQNYAESQARRSGSDDSQHSQARDPASQHPQANDSNHTRSNYKSHDSVKLPRISLPTFHGGYEHYRSFKEQFNSLIDKRDDLDYVEKFCYLKSSLKGEALQVIASLETVPENYKKAWDLLQQRFDNKRLVVSRHLKAIFESEKIDKASSVKIRSFIDNISKHMRSLESYQLPVSQWDIPMVHYLSQKLDLKTLREWESICKKDDLPSLQEFIDFLRSRAQILEAIEVENPQKGHRNYPNGKVHTSHSAALNTTQNSSPNSKTNNLKCPICQYSHPVYNCRKFLIASIDDRNKLIAKTNICTNCLKSTSHTSENCNKGPCKRCPTKHNSLLHKDEAHQPTTTSSFNMATNEHAALVNTANHVKSSTILLSTVVLQVLDNQGRPHQCRALLDSGSQINCISEKMAQTLGSRCFKRNSAICGIGGARSSCVKGMNCSVQSQDSSFKVLLECVVLPKITLELPTTELNISQWKLPSHITLADPAFFKKASIDMLIGAAEFFNIVGSTRISLGPDLPILTDTKFGWIVTGKVSQPECSEQHLNLAVESYNCCLELEDSISRFWELEEVSVQRSLTPEEKICESIFTATTKRDFTGRFEVNLPVKHNIDQLGDSKEIALKRFLALERKLSKNPSLREHYVSFMREYQSLGHMEPVEEADEPHPAYYMPHHSVVNEHSSTTKLRVVFDGSCKTTSGISLNDVLMVGPTIQEDLLSIIMRFRKYKFVMTGDITKMYRQINVNPDHRSLQRIFWRESPDQTIQIFNLKTVTYGTASASYLSTRCLKELSSQHKEKFPQGALAVERDFYVDDFLSGCDTLTDAAALQQQVIHILGMGNFQLHKWCSNHPQLVKDIPHHQRESKYELTTENKAAVKTLGVWWNPSSDMFRYSINIASEEIITKRGILSEIARIFDPMGLLGPVILKAKLFMKQLWSLNIDWDTPLDSVLSLEWIEFRSQLALLEELEIPRLIVASPNTEVEIHGFSDSSELAYGAAIYVRSRKDAENWVSHLLCSKSRVAPLKGISIPRLELCGALLLARLLKKCLDSLSFENVSCHLWTDSMVTLSWISQPSAQWKTFVCNRVAEIHDLTSTCQWHHVPGPENPSDLLSRGQTPEMILQSEFWWHGPSWLMQSKEFWPMQTPLHQEITEMKRNVSLATALEKPVIIFSRFSNFNRLINAVVYVQRFIDHLPTKPCVTGPISAAEKDRALLSLIKLVQRESFQAELKHLFSSKPLSKMNSLARLNPIFDNNEIVRVGGRLQNAELQYDQKHQIILPAHHRFTFLLVESYHRKHLHCGPQLLLATLRQQYWPLQGKSIVRKVFKSCITCFRNQPKPLTQIMGDLPTARVRPARPFINAGVDFCGPISIKSSTLRNAKILKAYIAVFVCLSTKAVHVELVGDMSTPAFICALKRFFARRGKARHMFSDNGTNFVGAARELNEYLGHILQDPTLSNYVSGEGVNWHFSPPRAPHFGGIWEAAIKSLKFHLKRVIGDTKLTFEQLGTVLAMIEATLNSRPLLPLSDNPSDLSALTPGHFLIGDAITALVEPDVTSSRTRTLTRWSQLQQMFQHFWRRWSLEYLSSLQVRQKWTVSSPNLLINKLVLIMEDNLPPLKWVLGRIIETHPGHDGLVRVATVKTATGVLKRPISKLCPLPEDDATAELEDDVNAQANP